MSRPDGELAAEYGGGIDDERQRPERTAPELARAVQDGRQVGAALRHLDVHSSEPGATGVADALARFLVARCDSHHAGWRVVRQVVVDSAADAPWEKCARRAVPVLAEDLITLAGERGRTQLARAQHMAAQRRAEQIAPHVDQAAVLAELGLKCSAGTPDRWSVALRGAVRARSRKQVALAVDRSLRERVTVAPPLQEPHTGAAGPIMADPPHWSPDSTELDPADGRQEGREARPSVTGAT